MNYNDYESTDGDSQSYETMELIMTTNAAVEAEFNRVFGSSSQYGQSLGVNMTDVELVDGGLYYDPEKDKYKLFSWREIRGVDNMDAVDRGMEPEADDADRILSKTYVGNQKTYELIAARVPLLTGPDGDVLVEPTSISRDFSWDGDDLEFTEFTDHGGDMVPFGFNTISWHSGHEEYGPSAASTELARVLTSLGDGLILDEGDLYNWLSDVSGSNLLREELTNRRVRYFKIPRESENGRTYHVPIIEDVSTGERIQRNNRAESDDSDELSEARERDQGAYPEPIANYIDQGDSLRLNERSANSLLDDLVADSSNSLTEEMIEDNGGRDEIVSQVL